LHHNLNRKAKPEINTKPRNLNCLQNKTPPNKQNKTQTHKPKQSPKQSNTQHKTNNETESPPYTTNTQSAK